MTEQLTVTTERVDDIPILLAHMIKMGLPNLLDEYFAVHGNWQGLSLGWTSVVWLAHILSEGDHRLNQVQPWAEKRLDSLGRCTGQPVEALAFSDDRLAGVLTTLSDDDHWARFETALNQRTIRVYDLRPTCVRVDSTTASSYGVVTEEGLLQFGHSKDHRPDLPQLKIMQAVLDPLGMPLATHVVSGQKADDPLYVPAIAQVRQGLRQQGLLYVGDSKMLALDTRAFIQANNRFGYDELIAKFNEARRRGFWTPRSNSAYQWLERPDLSRPSPLRGGAGGGGPSDVTVPPPPSVPPRKGEGGDDHARGDKK